MSPRRRPGRSRDGIFTWTADGIEAGEVQDNPLVRPCPACGAAIGTRCTQITRKGRRDRSPHPSRQETAE
jgi:predicted RNA-binding Zn-ribbon protein involved in translation (DUF1610 family)